MKDEHKNAMDTIHRVLVVGTSGSGKTTFAARLAQLLAVSHVELDSLHWEPNWVKAPLEIFRERVDHALSGERWVVDGNHSKVRDIVWQRADTVVCLDYSIFLSLWRLVRRTSRRIFTQEKLWNGNRESFRSAFIGRDSLFVWAITSRRRHLRDYPRLFKEYTHLRSIRLYSPRETADAYEADSNYKPMNKGKAVFTRMSLVYMELHNSLTACNYTLPTWTSPRKDRKYRGDVEMEAKVLSAVTGDKISRADIKKTGLRILTLFRALTALHMNEKDMRNKHDMINDWIFDYPKDKPAFTAGVNRMDRADIELGKDMLYAELGWDKTTGMPTTATLDSLGLTYVADALGKAGLLPPAV